MSHKNTFFIEKLTDNTVIKDTQGDIRIECGPECDPACLCFPTSGNGCYPNNHDEEEVNSNIEESTIVPELP